MVEFPTSGSAFFPGWVSIVFSIGLGLGILHHAPCLVHGHGSRWFHAGHVAMALSMIYMYLSMSYDWDWLPGSWQMWFFVGTSAVVLGYLAMELFRGRPVNFAWLLLLIQHAAMIYMWYPMMRWNAIVIFVLVSWFAVELFGWAANLFPDDVRSRENRRWFPHTVGHGAPGTTPVLITSGWKDRTLMSVMALSMGYMFYGMELMRMQMGSM